MRSLRRRGELRWHGEELGVGADDWDAMAARLRMKALRCGNESGGWMQHGGWHGGAAATLARARSRRMRGKVRHARLYGSPNATE